MQALARGSGDASKSVHRSAPAAASRAPVQLLQDHLHTAAEKRNTQVSLVHRVRLSMQATRISRSGREHEKRIISAPLPPSSRADSS